jgi:N-acyl amino acid synthase of PEP-CTERM/exosortase system
MRSVKTAEFIGCSRIVRPPANDPLYRLPFEEKCAGVLDRTIIDPAKLPRQNIAEVSRLAVIGGYRRRKGEHHSSISLADEHLDMEGLPRFPYIPIGLYLGTAELARLNGIETLFVLTEERLAHHFTKLGFQLQIIGSPIEHHGLRVPSVMSVSAIINNMRTILRPLYKVIAADIARYLQLNQAPSDTTMPEMELAPEHPSCQPAM